MSRWLISAQPSERQGWPGRIGRHSFLYGFRSSNGKLSHNPVMPMIYYTFIWGPQAFDCWVLVFIIRKLTVSFSKYAMFILLMLDLLEYSISTHLAGRLLVILQATYIIPYLHMFTS